MADLSQLRRRFIFFLVLAIQSSLVERSRSEVYSVGDGEGWDSGVDYGVWSQKYNFSAGDILVFKYVKSQHNAYGVTESTFRSCNSSTGVLARYETGDDRVTLKEARKYWFICNVRGHCLGGMRFGIDVKPASTNSSTPGGAPSPQVQPPPPTQGSDNNGNGSSKPSFSLGRWSLVFCLTVFDVLF